MTVEQLNVVISAKTDPIQQKLKELDKTLGKLEKTTETTTKKMTKSFSKSAFSINKMKLALIGIGIAAAKAGKALFSMGADAATVDNQVVALSKTMGGSSGDFMKWAQDVAVDFGISERAAASFGNQFSSIISRTEKDGAAVAELSQEYLKMGAIIAANTHFEIDDVMGRIRSGLSGRNEAIEDLGIEVKPGVIKGTEAYAAAVRNGGVAWEQMTDAQQASVRTQAILEQAQARYGTELQGTAGKLAVLRAAVDNMKLAWGRAFAPIVDFVIPVIQRLVGWLTVAATYVRAFLGLFFKVEGSVASANKQAAGFADSIGDASAGAGNISSGLDNANKSAKKLQRTLFGFDVIHNVAEPVDTPDAGGSGGGIGNIDTSKFELDGYDEGVGAFDELNKKIEEATSKIKSFGGKVKETFGSFIPLIAGVVTGFAGFSVIKGLWDLAGGAFIPFTGALKVLNPLMTALMVPLQELGIYAFMLGEKLLGLLGIGSEAVGAMTVMSVGFAAIAAVIALVVAALVSFYQKSETFRNTVSTAIQGVIDIFISLWEGTIKPIFEMIIVIAKVVWEQGIKPLWDSFVDFIGAIATLLLNIWNSVLQPLIKWFVDVFGPIIAVVIGVVVAAFGTLLVAASAIFGAILDVLTVVINWFSGFFAGTWKDVLDRIVELFGGAWDIIQWVISTILGAILAVIKFVLNAILAVIKFVLNAILAFVKFTWNAVKWVIEVTMKGIKVVIETIWNAVKWVIEVTMKGIKVVIETIWNVIKTVITTVLNAIKVIIETAWNVIKTVITTVINVIKTVITTVWETIKVAIQTVLNVIKTIITTIWEWIKDYFVRLFEVYKAMFTTIFNVIKTIIETVMNSIKTIIETIWNVIKTVFNTGLDFIKTIFTTGFNAVKLVVSTVMNSVKTTITTVMDTVKGVFQGLTNFIKGVFTGDWSKAWDGVISIFRNLFGLVPKIFKTAWDTVMKLFSGGGTIFKGFAESVADIFKKLVNSLISGINTVIGAPFKALNKAFDKFKGISILGMKPFSWLPSIDIPAIPQFAQGGFPEDGLFHANSRELVGKFSNGKTAVANNDQIISGVSTGVANAVRGVLGDGMKSDQPINLTVQIGSNTIAKEVINAVDEYTMRTGLTFKTI